MEFAIRGSSDHLNAITTIMFAVLQKVTNETITLEPSKGIACKLEIGGTRSLVCFNNGCANKACGMETLQALHR